MLCLLLLTVCACSINPECSRISRALTRSAPTLQVASGLGSPVKANQISPFLSTLVPRRSIALRRCPLSTIIGLFRRPGGRRTATTRFTEALWRRRVWSCGTDRCSIPGSFATTLCLSGAEPYSGWYWGGRIQQSHYASRKRSNGCEL